MLPRTTGEFRLADEPALQFTPSGKPVTRLVLVANGRKQEADGTWVDDKTCWLRASVWGKAAETCAESLKKGDLVVVTGREHTEEWEKDGVKMRGQALTVEDIGPSLRWNAHHKVEGERTTTSAPAQAAADPWSNPPSQNEEPPF